MTNPRVVPVEIFDWLNQQKKRLPSVDPKRPVEFLQKYPVVKSPNFRKKTSKENGMMCGSRLPPLNPSP